MDSTASMATAVIYTKNIHTSAVEEGHVLGKLPSASLPHLNKLSMDTTSMRDVTTAVDAACRQHVVRGYYVNARCADCSRHGL